MSAQPESIAFAGSGAVAQALGRLLVESGARVSAIASRDLDHAQRAAAYIGGPVHTATYQQLPALATHIIIAVEDDAIGDVARLLAGGPTAPVVAVHTCGAKGADVLSALRARGSACGVLHPLQTIPDGERGVRALRAATIATGGDDEAAAWASSVASRIGAAPMRVASAGFPLYHAGAVLAGNGAFALIETAVSLLAAAGIERTHAVEALAPLCRHSLENALKVGASALTGPVSRGSATTVAAHLSAIRSQAPQAEGLYRSVSLVLAGLAGANGLDAASLHGVEKALTS